MVWYPYTSVVLCAARFSDEDIGKTDKQDEYVNSW
jgi:hypothetical protein